MLRKKREAFGVFSLIGAIRLRVDMSFKSDRRKEILDGKKAWTKEANAGNDADTFYTQFFLPLQELKAEGLFEKWYPHQAGRGFDKITISLINLEHPSAN